MRARRTGVVDGFFFTVTVIQSPFDSWRTPNGVGDRLGIFLVFTTCCVGHPQFRDATVARARPEFRGPTLVSYLAALYMRKYVIDL